MSNITSNSLVRKTLTNKTKGDFADLVEQDLHRLEIKENEEELKSMTKVCLKKIVKKNMKAAALNYLNQNKTSKTAKLNHTTLQMQQYLKSSIFSEQESSLLLALRTRTVRGIRTDFPGMFPTRECPLLGCREEDTLPHILSCSSLLHQVEEEQHRTNYSDIYSGSLSSRWQ